MTRRCGLLILLLAFLGGCDQGDRAIEEVKQYRRQFKISYDFLVDDKDSSLVYEITVQNLAGNMRIQDLTLDVQAMDADQQIFWTRRITLDVAGIGHHSSKVFDYKNEIEGVEELEYLNIGLAPDGEGSEYMKYPEFRRVAH